MFKNETILNLQENYKFDVSVMLGELDLTPHRCKLKIIGESRSKPSLSIGDLHIDRLECEAFSKSFIIFNLERTSIKSMRIPQLTGSIDFFECVYEIEFLFCCENRYEQQLAIDELSIFSKELASWIGLTNKRRSLIKNYVDNKQLYPSQESSSEFKCDIGNGDEITVHYDTNTLGYIDNSYTVGMSIIPCVTIGFDSRKSPLEAYESYLSLYYLISFFIGSDLNIDKVVFGYDYYYLNGSLCFPCAGSLNSESNRPILLSLANDLVFNDLDLMPLPDESFLIYFKLPVELRNYFYK